jgi:hypothetical protein
MAKTSARHLAGQWQAPRKPPDRIGTRLIGCGLQVLHEPAPPDLVSIARILVRFADTSKEQYDAVAGGLRDALGGPVTARITAEKFQALVHPVADEISARQDAWWLTTILKRPGTATRPAPPNGWADFDDEITTYSCPRALSPR